MKRGKRNICLLLAALLAGAVMLTGASAPAVSVRTERVSGGQLVQSALVQATVCRAQEDVYLCPKQGEITKVFVQEGQAVQKGELLFQMDVSREEMALAALYQNRYACEQAAFPMNEKLFSLTFSRELEWYEAEQQLQTMIRLSAVRAQTDGRVSAVYAGEGDIVAQGSVLGIGGSERIQFAVAADEEDVLALQPGAAAVLRNGDKDIPVVLDRTEPVKERPMDGIMYFEPYSSADAADYQAGQSMQMELIYGTLDAEALLPFEAIDADGKAWYVREGKACGETVVFGKNNRTHVMVNAAWNGREVILYPDKAGLTNGARVQVKR